MTKLLKFAPPKHTILASAVLCALGVMPFAYAEEANEPAAEEQIERIAVTYRASLAAAADLKREDDRVADVITSEDIGKFPTENIAEAIQRIPGVQISNVNGRGSTISVRGLGAQYARTTVNGQSFNSADFTSGFRFDIIQSELASNISVVKSPTADMDAGGLSGTINIDTANPLSYDERKLLVSAKGQYSEFSPTGDVTPKGTVTYIDQFLDSTVGVFLNAGYQELDDRVDNFWIDRWFENEDGTELPRRPRDRRIDRETKRYLYNGAFQWRPTDSFEGKFTAVYAQDKTKQDLNQLVFGFDRDYTFANSADTDGVFTNVSTSNIWAENNRQLEDKDAVSQGYTLQGKYELDNWTISGVLNYTTGKATQVEDAVILATYLSADLDISNPDDVYMSLGGTDLSDPSTWAQENLIRNEYPNGATRIMESKESSAQLDIKRTFDGFFSAVSFGSKFRHETFDRNVWRTDRITIGDAAPEDLPPFEDSYGMVSGFLDNQYSIPHSWAIPDIQAYKDALVAEGVTIPTLFAAQSSYSIDRDIWSAYLKLDFQSEIGDFPIRGNVGGRYERTSRDLNTFLTGEQHPTNEDIREVLGSYTTSYDYSNFLPSLNVSMELNEEMLIRFAAAKVLVRPIITGDTQLAASESSGANSEGTRTYAINLGQPDMKAMTANQVDLGWEWYYGEGDSLTISGFWKGIRNGTVSEYTCPADYNGTPLSNNGENCVDASGNIYEIMTTYNDDSTLNIKGYEVAWNQGLDQFLPLEGFGISANYTRIYVGDSEGYTLTNSSEQTWNLTGYWENEAFSARVSLNHRSPYVQDNTDSFFAREGRVVDGRNQIDMLLGWNATDNLSVRLGALNITGNDETAFRSDSAHVWQTTSVIGRSYYLNATYSF
ncbi:TonB-dependent receptor [Shewanella avicenniae]|uniref:TonB-dependent receptor n=1 Tax=Shewanella avicenniae TaxID=2814294 RepID=A0ABX7QMK4_9GAMM|nr:TonB-dependent receptor [Shewanella avicenniae]QSX32669.1 TonB-dependent receptor [Shewanella avicenniae]